jgi:hypothetical protein
MSEWIKKQIKKDIRRWKKRPQMYAVLFTSLGSAFFLGIIGFAILNRPTVDSNRNTLYYEIPFSTGFYLLILGFCWVVATCIVGVFVDMLVDKELAEERALYLTTSRGF